MLRKDPRANIVQKGPGTYEKYSSTIRNAAKLIKSSKQSLWIKIAKNIKDDSEAFYRYDKDK